MANSGEDMKKMLERIQREQTERMKKINERVCGSVKNPYVPTTTASFLNPQRNSDDMFAQLAKENKKLTEEKIKLNLKILQLEEEKYELMENYAKLKSYIETNKTNFWKDLNKTIKSIYQKIINWFNT